MSQDFNFIPYVPDKDRDKKQTWSYNNLVGLNKHEIKNLEFRLNALLDYLGLQWKFTPAQPARMELVKKE